MLILSERDVERLLTLPELLPAMKQALTDFSCGRVTQPVRTIVPLPEYEGFFGVMPAVYRDVLGSKLVTVFPRNAALGVHTHNALIQLFRAETGEPLATMDGRLITAWRTAAVSAIATRELSDPNARVLTILGSGVQARSHYTALHLVREFAETRVWSRTPDHARRFAAEIGARTMSAEDAVRGADVIVTVTGSPTPIVRGEWLKSRAHVNAIGAVGPQFREIDEEAMRRSAVIVESREAAIREAGEIIQSGVTIYAELGEILIGSKQRPGTGPTIYKSLGIAVEDIAAAKLIYEKRMRELVSRG